MLEFIEESKSVLGEHPNRQTSIFDLTLIYYAQGRKAEVESLDEHVLEARKKAVGEHSETQLSMLSLGIDFVQEETWKMARTLWIELIQTTKDFCESGTS